MPRRNKNFVKDHKPKGQRGKPVPAAKPDPIDWSKYSVGRSREASPAVAVPEKKIVRNEFTRNVQGFGNKALLLFSRSGLHEIADTGVVAVQFEGISPSPRKAIELRKPQAIKNRFGLLILAAAVPPVQSSEIGDGKNTIRQLDEPVVDGFDTKGRINIGLGKPKNTPNLAELSSALRSESELVLSEVIEINGRAVVPQLRDETVTGMWNRPPKLQSIHDWR